MKTTLTLALLALALVARPAAAQEPTGTLRKVKDSGAITIGHRENSIPFSFVDDKQQPMGYSMDICAAIVEEVKRELSLPTLAVHFAAVTPQTRIQLMANGSIDLECGSTTNTLTRQKQVSFAPTTFISGTKLQPGCLGCSAWADADFTVHYVESWRSEEDLRHHVASPLFTSLLAAVESMTEAPHVQFDFLSSSRGLDYVAEVRGQPLE